jgi:hypothetical protein
MNTAIKTNGTENKPCGGTPHGQPDHPMSSSPLSTLLEISSNPLGSNLSSRDCPSDWNGLKLELFDLLLRKNGLVAFETALLIRPLNTVGEYIGVNDWNEPSLWLDAYKIELPDLFFFAEDVFGGQFAIAGDTIVMFDPETGAIEEIDKTFEGWATKVLSEYDFYTGHLLAHKWQQIHGPIRPGRRLIPKQLFILGGDFDIENLMIVNDVKSMRSRGFFATELKDVPEGGHISFRLVD